jgi:hypothetical protein
MVSTGGALCRGHDTPACWFAGCANWRRSRCGAPPHRPEGKAGFRNRPSREGRVIKLRWVFSACSARSSHCCCSCSDFVLVTGSTAASAAVAHLRANCRRYSGRARIQSNRRGLFMVYRDGTAFPAVAPKQRPAPQPAYRNNQKGPTLFQALDRKSVRASSQLSRKSGLSCCQACRSAMIEGATGEFLLR